MNNRKSNRMKIKRRSNRMKIKRRSNRLKVNKRSKRSKMSRRSKRLKKTKMNKRNYKKRTIRRRRRSQRGGELGEGTATGEADLEASIAKAAREKPILIPTKPTDPVYTPGYPPTGESMKIETVPFTIKDPVDLMLIKAMPEETREQRDQKLQKFRAWSAKEEEELSRKMSANPSNYSNRGNQLIIPFPPTYKDGKTSENSIIIDMTKTNWDGFFVECMKHIEESIMGGKPLEKINIGDKNLKQEVDTYLKNMNQPNNVYDVLSDLGGGQALESAGLASVNDINPYAGYSFSYVY